MERKRIGRTLEGARELEPEKRKEEIESEECDGEAGIEVEDENAQSSELHGKQLVANSPFISPSPPQLVLPSVDAESPPRTRDGVEHGVNGPKMAGSPESRAPLAKEQGERENGRPEPAHVRQRVDGDEVLCFVCSFECGTCDMRDRQGMLINVLRRRSGRRFGS